MKVENIALFNDTKIKKSKQISSEFFTNELAKVTTKTISNNTPTLLSTLNNSIKNELDYKNELNKAKSSIQFGYSVDNDGFLGADFNKAAGLPDDFKIHSSTLKEIVRFNEKMNVYSVMKDSGKTFSNIDLADTIKHYYDLFTQITHNNQDYPSGISIDFGYSKVSFDYINDISKYKITNIYKNNEELEYAKSIKADGFSVIELSFEPKNISVDKELAFSPDFSMYNEKEKKFIGFLQSINPFASDSGTTRLSKDALKYALAMQDDYNNINKDIKKHKDLLKIADEIKHLGIDELLKTNTEVAKFLDKTKA